MERLLQMDKEQFIAEMLQEVRRALGEVADAVNNAPDGNVISGSEVAVRDAMVELQRKVFQSAVQKRIDSTESSFSPSEGRERQGQAKQGTLAAEHAEPQRPDRAGPPPVVRAHRRKR